MRWVCQKSKWAHGLRFRRKLQAEDLNLEVISHGRSNVTEGEGAEGEKRARAELFRTLAFKGTVEEKSP